MIHTLIKQTQSQHNSVISISSSQSKLVRRTSKSNSLKIKRSESQSQLEKTFPTYFIKKVPKFNSKNNEEQLSTTEATPAKVIKRRGDYETMDQKKRQPTPVKSYRQINDEEKTHKKNSNNAIDILKEMQIHELEKKLQCESKIRMMFQHRSKQFENEVSIQAKKVKSLEKQLEIANQKQSLLKQRIVEISSQLQTKSNDLKCTKSNLEKLKENIKEVKNQQFQVEIKKSNEEVLKYKNMSQEQSKLLNCLKNQNTALKMQINRIKSISEQSKIKVQEQNKVNTLSKQIQYLKAELKKSKTQRQIFLEQKLLDLYTQMQSLKKLYQSKLIEIDFLNRKKHDQLQILRKRKGEQIRGLRIKFAALMDEYKSLKHSKKDAKDKDQRGNYRSIEKKPVENRQNRFACPNKDRCEEDYVCFSLSPDMK